MYSGVKNSSTCVTIGELAVLRRRALANKGGGRGRLSGDGGPQAVKVMRSGHGLLTNSPAILGHLRIAPFNSFLKVGLSWGTGVMNIFAESMPNDPKF